MTGQNDDGIKPPDVFSHAGRLGVAESSTEQEEGEGNWGVVSRGVGDFFEVTDSSGNPFVIAYGLQSDWSGKKGVPHVVRFTFLCWGEPAWLTITAHKNEVKFLRFIVMALQHRTLKSLRADGEKIMSVSVEWTPHTYYPFAAARVKFDRDAEKECE